MLKMQTDPVYGCKNSLLKLIKQITGAVKRKKNVSHANIQSETFVIRLSPCFVEFISFFGFYYVSILINKPFFLPPLLSTAFFPHFRPCTFLRPLALVLRSIYRVIIVSFFVSLSLSLISSLSLYPYSTRITCFSDFSMWTSHPRRPDHSK